jgi:hypothetical protein
MSGRPRWAFVLLFAVLVLVRVPSLAQPAGGDQGLYAYVGQRVLAGELPYRDAWDQKPPAIHVAYAAMLAAWPDLRVVAAADLLLAVLTAAMLVPFGRAFRVPGGGETAALLYLGLANPLFGRLGGVRVRAQCEVFIAAAVTLAMLLAWYAARRRPTDGRVLPLAAGLAAGVAITFKYNAGAALIPVALMTWLGAERPGLPWRAFVWLGLGAAVPVAAMVAVFAWGGALADLYHATYTYNVFYSGETYRDAWHALTYFVTFPVQHARVDSLWWLGGAACVVLLVLSVHRALWVVVPAWVAAACVSIAVNGSRGLPQYFLQAWPALALAAGLVLALAWRRTSLVPRLVLIALVATGIWRVTTIPKGLDYAWHDVEYLRGRITRDAYLARFGQAGSGDKYSALAIEELAGYLRERTAATDTVLVFGFSPAALVEARRQSASRFFWSRPVIVGFREGATGYGVDGVLADLDRSRPALVVLQRHDWDPDGPDSWTFFTGEPRLAAWLHAHYAFDTELGNFAIWRRAGS